MARTVDNGYGAEHKAERRHWERILNTGTPTPCARCGETIDPSEPWDLGHNDERTAWTGPEHAGQCNRAAGGRTRKRLARTVTRDWDDD